MNSLSSWINEILYPAVFQSVDKVFSEHHFEKFSQGWRSQTYLYGEAHKKRRDKTIITKKYPGKILEQGGDTMSLIDYVIKRDGVDFIDAVKKLAAAVGLVVPGMNKNSLSPIIKKQKISDFKYKPPEDPDYLPLQLIANSGRGFKNNNLILYLKNIFGLEATKQAILKYLIGTSDYFIGATIFWQIDDCEKVRHGKIMLYDSKTGKRVKDPYPRINSVANVIGIKDFKLNQCLFGLHLLNESVSDSMAIVEAEKTAVAMSIIKPDVTWMATGSKHGFNYEMLKPLRNKRIVAYPDKGEFFDWQAAAMDLNHMGFNIYVDDTLENALLPRGADLADLVFQNERNYNIKKVDEDTVQIAQESHSTKCRMDDLSARMIHTKTERDVSRLAMKNSNILKLIKGFDLTHPNGHDLCLPD